jgi:uridine kinase
MIKPSTITCTIEGSSAVTCPADTPVEQLLRSRTDEQGRHYLGAVVNNQVVSLVFRLEVDSTVRFLTFADPLGWRIYRTTASFLLAKVVKELFPDAKFSIEHSLGTGFYCYFEQNGAEGISDAQLAAIDQRMHELVAQDMPVERRKVRYEEAVALFEQQGLADKVNLLRYRNPPKVVIFQCEGFADLLPGPHGGQHGRHLPLRPDPPGAGLRHPVPRPQHTAPHPHPAPGTAAVQNLPGTQEMGPHPERQHGGPPERNHRHQREPRLHPHRRGVPRKENRENRRPRVRQQGEHPLAAHRRPVLVGQNHLCQTLAVQLRVNGLQPVTVSVDNYFVDRDHTPKDAKGENDYEHIEAIDLKLFNEHLQRLDAGKKSNCPPSTSSSAARSSRATSSSCNPTRSSSWKASTA